jgi:hypothetical protein
MRWDCSLSPCTIPAWDVSQYLKCSGEVCREVKGIAMTWQTPQPEPIPQPDPMPQPPAPDPLPVPNPEPTPEPTLPPPPIILPDEDRIASAGTG